MKKKYHAHIEAFMDEVESRNPGEPEFLQSVREVAETVIPFISEHPKYSKANILHRMVEPERVIMFRVPWVDDEGKVQVNRGYRVQFNSAIGPYKGGLRFHPSVNLSVLKFLGFEQIFKNALTTLPLGGAKGGSEFDPKGKSNLEVMRFCQSFMTELQRHINKYTDVPAGDIGVGAREIGFLFGQYKRLQNEFTGVLTGKDLNWGGSFIRPEATGYGTVYFIAEILAKLNDSFEGKSVAVSGSGNVAQFTVEKVIELGGKVISVSDSSGCIMAKDGLTHEHLEFMKRLKNETRGRIHEMADKFSELSFQDSDCVWNLPINIDIAIPCATQNELDAEHARHLIDKRVKIVGEGANMPCTSEAVHLFQDEGVIFAPGKAVNAGGVATSGLEMAQNALRLSWDREKVDSKLLGIMKNIHQQCVTYGENEDGSVDYVRGANLAGFVKVADAMMDQGAV
ncbi:NADP-specific glutamate dehydrogenase [Balneolales bacterium ANBcel1]|nr:NADP-specific glutamate dehydrogenase [Balneolales bacterium ANBcel1]